MTGPKKAASAAAKPPSSPKNGSAKPVAGPSTQQQQQEQQQFDIPEGLVLVENLPQFRNTGPPEGVSQYPGMLGIDLRNPNDLPAREEPKDKPSCCDQVRQGCQCIAYIFIGTL
jgi:hypothetical protein